MLQLGGNQGDVDVLPILNDIDNDVVSTWDSDAVSWHEVLPQLSDIEQSYD
jgi:hypothetical protein